MIKRSSLLVSFCTLLVFSITCPSIAYTSMPADSIRVKWMDGKKFILHKVEPKETWQNLSKRYNCTLADLKAANEGVEQLKIGQIINVPVNVSLTPKVKEIASFPATEKETPKTTSSVPVIAPQKGIPVKYVVKKGETMYSIARRYNMTVSDMKSINKLNSDILSEGQELIVGFQEASPTPKTEPKPEPVRTEPTKAAPVKTEPIKTAPAQQPDAKPEVKPSAVPKAIMVNGVSPAANYDKPTKSISPVKKGNAGKALMQVTETGVASWIQEGQVKNDKYYALHRSAPIGTIVKVTNRMNSQFVYVKVVGALPDTGENENIIIKVSQAVSSKLVALDPLFQVELSYGSFQ